MTNSPDLDYPVDISSPVYDAFGVRLYRVNEYRTLGDVHRTLVAAFAEQRGGKCATAMAFFRLRRALGRRRGLAPSLDLETLAPRRASGFLKALGRQTGLTMPEAHGDTVQNIGAILMIGSVLAGAGLLTSEPSDYLWIVLAVFALGGAIASLGGSKFYESTRTLGRLAGRVAALNFGRLVKQGAHAGPDQLWAALVEIAGLYTDIPRDQLRPETPLAKFRRDAGY